MRSPTLPSPRQVTSDSDRPAFPDYYAEERWAKARAQARQARARKALQLVGLLVGAVGISSALRAWDSGLQP